MLNAAKMIVATHSPKLKSPFRASFGTAKEKKEILNILAD
jgi:hypothetical protein